MSDRIDWKALLRLGLRDMRLQPDAFWRLTPAEFLLMAGIGSAAPMTRSGLQALQAQFPDETKRADLYG
jgi:uncharacterized phage protein (TIGR02216 family)